MTLNRTKEFSIALLLITGFFSCKTRSFIENSNRKVIDTVLAGVHFSNNFPAARMNSLVMDNDSSFTMEINPENKPINPSPWYAFKIWSSKSAAPVYIRLKYTGFKHRYQPKTSLDGRHWQEIPKARVNANKTEAVFKLNISPDTLTVAAQEIMDSKSAYQWIDSLTTMPNINKTIIGKSVMGRPIIALNTKGSDGKKLVIVLSRQHPPEVSGYMAMQEFVRTISSASELAVRFRKSYEVIMIPMINPDGVDEGHWRHNVNGVDLNRDWEKFVQPETRSIRDYLLKKIDKQKAKTYFGLDFHSTYNDVFYTNTDQEGAPTNSPGFTVAWLKEFEHAIPGFKANVKPSGNGGNVSKSWMGRILKAEALTYEVGDNTSRPMLKLKGKVAAEKMMELLLKKNE